MLGIKPATRLALTIGFVTATLVWVAFGLNMIPNPKQSKHEKRVAITKTLAASATGLASQNRIDNLQRALDLSANLNEDVESVGVYSRNSYKAHTKGHPNLWVESGPAGNPDQASMEILANGKNWGTLQIRFGSPSESNGFFGLNFFHFLFPYSLIAFIGASSTILSWLILNKTFKYLNPSKVVPKRVRSAFDTLTEGLVLINAEQEIAHVNQSFGRIIEKDSEALIGTNLNELGWQLSNSDEFGSKLPWLECIETEEAVIGRILELGQSENRRKFFVNAAPILGDKSDCRGAMISFDDVTAMERKKSELASMIKTLRSSRDEVERQNQQLTFLASYDPLTKCLNRRAFWIEFEQLWTDVEPDQLSLIMIDVDHFKQINDTHGHSFGDVVLTRMGDALRNTVSDRGIVCRYGGEEFVVAIPNMDVESAMALTHEVHREIQEMDIEGKKITASIGYSNRAFKAMDGQHLLDQADQCLYSAKHNGRNCVVRFDECDNNVLEQEAPQESEPQEGSPEIHYTAVSGLLSALAFRCPATADHSTRVADLCVNLGSKILNRRDLYRLEVAALLHDIGKIGVPDAILHKPGKLNAEEWAVMNQHEKIGLQIIRSAFSSDAVPKIIEAHRESLQNDNAKTKSSFDSSINTCVSIIKVCDAFDSMIHDSVYRTGLSPEEALHEIVNCTPKQFDVEVVTKLVEYVRDFSSSLKKTSRRTPTDQSVANHKSETMGQHIENLNRALESKDVQELQKVVSSLKSQAVNAQNQQVASAAMKLEAAINVPTADDDLEDVLSLANEIASLCDKTRVSLIDDESLATPGATSEASSK
jgi:diguanylate cyclase (GGDEF)-like protein/putative nucleotidyltransferase with HDIG domain